MMRLINTFTLQLERFREDDVPEYAVLSHRWDIEEVELGQFYSPAATRRYGYWKLINFCRIARLRGCRYAWMDTCCIDQKDPTEISEAINSMFRWYTKAKTCIVFLSDIVHLHDLHQSAWFARGWTLQELIAPRHVEFFNGHWDFLGLKSNLVGQLAAITNIQASVLAGASPQTCSVAQRMSWAAHRSTTRIEDRAYSLLGLFGVSMHVTYGIGEEAFIKLQEAIMQRSSDQTIFAWTEGFSKQHSRGLCGLLAQSPSAFRGCQNMVRSEPSGLEARFGMGQLGLEIRLHLLPVLMNTYLAVLDCSLLGEPSTRYGIFLERSPESMQYNRVRLRGMSIQTLYWPRSNIPQGFRSQQVFVRQQPENFYPDLVYGFHIEHVDLPGNREWAIERSRIWSRYVKHGHHNSKYMFLPPGRSGLAGFVSFPVDRTYTLEKRVYWIKFGFDDDFDPIVVVGDRKSRATDFGVSGIRRTQEHRVNNRNLVDQGSDDDMLTLTTLLNPRDSKMKRGHARLFTSKTTDPWSRPLAPRRIVSTTFGLVITFELKPYRGPAWAPGMSEMRSPHIWTVRIEDLACVSSKNSDKSNPITRSRGAFVCATVGLIGLCATTLSSLDGW